MTTAARDLCYLEHVLQMNPLHEAKTIMASRAAHLRPETSYPSLTAEPQPVTDRFYQAAARVESLRNQIWTLDDELLHRQLEQLTLNDFPELLVSVNRLREVAERREAFQRLENHPVCFPQFIDAFRRVAVAPPRQILEVRVFELDNARQNSHGHSPTQYQNVVRLVRDEFPELYGFEEEWLARIGARPSRLNPPPNFWVGTLVLMAIIVSTGLSLYLQLSISP